MDQLEMNQNQVEKINKIYHEAKVLAEEYNYDDVFYNIGHTQRDISNEYAKQINISNKYRQKEKDLYFLLSILQEAQRGVSQTPKCQKLKKQLDGYIENIKSLLKVYTTIEQMQISILKYYERGGATF